MINFTQEIQLAILGGGILFLVLSIIFFIGNIKKNLTLKKFVPILDIEKHQRELEKQSEKLKKEVDSLISIYISKETQLKKDYKNAQSENKKKKADLLQKYNLGVHKLNDLKTEIAKYETDMESIDLGFSKPIFEFNDSEKYKRVIIMNKTSQKDLVKRKEACKCDEEWSVGGSKAEGRKMTNRNIALAIKSFNNDCDTLISKATWNNYDSMINRIIKSFDYINKMNDPTMVYITQDYLDLKIRELELVHHYKEKKYQENEEQKAINAEIREQKKVEAEIKKKVLEKVKEEKDALKNAQIAEDAYKKGLKDYEKKNDAEKDIMKEQLKILKKQCEDAVAIANEKTGEKVRIESMAQHTKMGRVYILSNIGSFGSDICKIGMTRALDPMDRVHTLSGASVPFEFDCHAMIATKDAPALENALHDAFNDRRVNFSNLRKEHFRVSLDEIESWLNSNGYEDVDFTKSREARTYRETQAILKADEKAKSNLDIIDLVDLVDIKEDDLFEK